MKNTQQVIEQYDYDLNKCIHQPLVQKLFFDYLQESQNAENLHFALSYEQLIALPSNKRSELAWSLYQTYVEANSPKELNLNDNERIKCFKLLQANKYQKALMGTYSATMIHMAHLFGMFKRSKEFVNLLLSKNREFLTGIGMLKTDMVMNYLDVNDLERCYFVKHDFFVAQELIKDFQHWKLLYSDENLSSSLMYSTRVFQTDAAVTKFGYVSPQCTKHKSFMTPFKTTFVIEAECTLDDLLKIYVTPTFLKEFYPMNSIEALQVMQNHTFPAVVIHGGLNYGPLFTPRHFCELWTIESRPNESKYIVIRKNCDGTTFFKPEGVIMQSSFTVIAITELGPHLYHIEHVSLSSFGGTLSVHPSAVGTYVPLLKLMTGGIVKGFKRALLNRIEMLKQKKWAPLDELHLLDIIHVATK